MEEKNQLRKEIKKLKKEKRIQQYLIWFFLLISIFNIGLYLAIYVRNKQFHTQVRKVIKEEIHDFFKRSSND